MKPHIRWNEFDGMFVCFTGPSDGRAEGAISFGITPAGAYKARAKDEADYQLGEDRRGQFVIANAEENLFLLG